MAVRETKAQLISYVVKIAITGSVWLGGRGGRVVLLRELASSLEASTPPEQHPVICRRRVTTQVFIWAAIAGSRDGFQDICIVHDLVRLDWAANAASLSGESGVE